MRLQDCLVTSSSLVLVIPLSIALGQPSDWVLRESQLLSVVASKTCVLTTKSLSLPDGKASTLSPTLPLFNISLMHRASALPLLSSIRIFPKITITKT